jgi:hypothetical protein
VVVELFPRERGKGGEANNEVIVIAHRREASGLTEVDGKICPQAIQQLLTSQKIVLEREPVESTGDAVAEMIPADLVFHFQSG